MNRMKPVWPQLELEFLKAPRREKEEPFPVTARPVKITGPHHGYTRYGLVRLCPGRGSMGTIEWWPDAFGLLSSLLRENDRVGTAVEEGPDSLVRRC